MVTGEKKRKLLYIFDLSPREYFEKCHPQFFQGVTEFSQVHGVLRMLVSGFTVHKAGSIYQNPRTFRFQNISTYYQIIKTDSVQSSSNYLQKIIY